MDSFILLAYASLAASRTLLQLLLACLNFALDSEDLSCWNKQKSAFYELWQQHKQRKNMDMRLDLILTMKDTYINSNLRPFTKFTINSKRTEFKDILPWNIPQVVTKTVPISTRIVISYAIKQFILLRFW